MKGRVSKIVNVSVFVIHLDDDISTPIFWKYKFIFVFKKNYSKVEIQDYLLAHAFIIGWHIYFTLTT